MTATASRAAQSDSPNRLVGSPATGRLSGRCKEFAVALAASILLVGWPTPPLPAGETAIDALAYRDTWAARRIWRAGEGTPPVDVRSPSARPILVVSPPLRPTATRLVIDRKGHWDLRSPSALVLEAAVRSPSAATHITLYLHSGRGWYAQSTAVGSTGWKRLLFPKRDFTTEGDPSGWKEIDQIRIALWYAADTPPEARPQLALRRLAFIEYPVLVLFDGRNDASGTAHRRVAERVARLLDHADLPADSLAERALRDAHLRSRRVVILPLNPRLPEAAIRRLAAWVERGGKLVACYHLPQRLGQAMGIAQGAYVRPTQRSGLGRIVPVEPVLPGFPSVVRQASWNIVPGIAAGHGARVVAMWQDADGRPTGHVAWVVSRRGAYFSHIVLEDDPGGKEAMLRAVLGALDDKTWRDAVTTLRRRTDRIGHCLDLDAWRAFVTKRGGDKVTGELKAIDSLAQQLEQLLRESRYAAAYELARTLDRKRRLVYRRAFQSPLREARAWWNHSGTGAYPGDWERTARELAANGFNMVFPNMLWGGVAHYKSQVLPQSDVVRRYGDQIAQCVAAAHRHGIEVHVWKVDFNLGRAPREFVDRLRREGRLQVSYRGEPRNWLNPAHPKNIELEVESLVEVVRRYDVDGIHFDYIRYPDRDYDYSDYSRSAFEQSLGRRVTDWPAECHDGALREAYARWRRDQITHVVQTVARRVRKIKPSIRISAAVFGAYPDCRTTVGQDWALWAKKGYVDFLCPMDYTDSDAAFVKLIRRQRRVVGPAFPLYPGIGATASRSRLDPERVLGQIHLARREGMRGFTIFNLNATTLPSIGPAFRAGAGARPAVPPHRP